MSMEELDYNEVKFTIVKLSETECQDKISYIRRSKPDYLLQISGLGISYKFIDDDGATDFPDRFYCSFFLNYGDLFLYGYNCLKFENHFSTLIGKIFLETLEKREKCNEIIRCSLSGQNKLLGDDLLTANREYAQLYHSLAFHSFISLILHEDEKCEGWLDYALGNLLWSKKPFEDGPLTAEQLQRNLDNRNSFSEITATVRYCEDGMEEYSFSNLCDLIGFEIRQLKGSGRCVKVCENCGRLFIPANRIDEKYCNYPLTVTKTCRQAAFDARLSRDDILKTYRKIYKTQNARKQRNSHRVGINDRFSKWTIYAKSRLDECRKGNITLETMVKDISADSWMSE